MTDIEPCPFCGRAPYIIYTDEEGNPQDCEGPLTDNIGLHCGRCDVTMMQPYISPDEDRAELIERWNRRPKARMDPKHPCRNCKHVCEGRAYIGDTAYGNTIDDSDCDYEDGCNEVNGYRGWEARE